MAFLHVRVVPRLFRSLCTTAVPSLLVPLLCLQLELRSCFIVEAMVDTNQEVDCSSNDGGSSFGVGSREDGLPPLIGIGSPDDSLPPSYDISIICDSKGNDVMCGNYTSYYGNVQRRARDGTCAAQKGATTRISHASSSNGKDSKIPSSLIRYFSARTRCGWEVASLSP